MELVIGGIAIVLIVQAMAGMKRTTERLHDIAELESDIKATDNAPLLPGVGEEHLARMRKINEGNAKDKANLTWLYVLAAIGLFLALASAGAL